MLRIIAFIIVVSFFAWAVPKMFASKPLPDQATMAAANNGGMAAAEVSYYQQIFDYVMDNTQPNVNYPWKSYSASGNIMPDAIFVSKSGSSCRKFKENASIGGKVTENSGVACKRKGSDGWCKLHDDNAMTCALEANWVSIPGMPNTNLSISGGSADEGNAGGINGNGTSVNTNVDAPHVDQKKAGTGYADTVTGAAGSTAGPAASHAIKWFGETFR